MASTTFDDLPYEEDYVEPAPPRRRLAPVTVALGTAALIAVGFLAGVLVQKHEGSSTAAAATSAAGAARARGAGAGGQGGQGGAGRGFGAARSGLAGQVKLVDGNNLYVTDFQGNTVKVATSDASRINKTSAGTIQDVKPGDTVVVQGPKGSDGNYTATTVTDTGDTGGFGGAAGGAGGEGGGASAGGGGGGGAGGG
jgi:hypothetical protein